MKEVSNKIEITKTFTEVRRFSFEEKKSPLLNEEEVNTLLDAILDFKKIISDKTNKLHDLNEGIEKLTWFNNLDKECLMLINDLISSAKDLRSTLVRQYVAMNFLRKKGVAKEEIKAFKYAIDELKESYEDLESVFFFLPKMPDFKETSKQLELV